MFNTLLELSAARRFRLSKTDKTSRVYELLSDPPQKERVASRLVCCSDYSKRPIRTSIYFPSRTSFSTNVFLVWEDVDR